MFVSYAQNFEDVILWRALKAFGNGFYIDIGAQDPIQDSVSLAFYQRGWRGIHVEPSTIYAQALREARPDEKVIEGVVGEETGDVPFHVFSGTGLSTVDADIAAVHESKGYPHATTPVAAVSLAQVLDECGDRDVHWLKIDVEGSEASVIRSWLPSEVRPWIVVVESVDPVLHQDRSYEWERELLSLGYTFAYADGLNRFYVSNRHLNLVDAIAIPPNVFDGFSLSGTSSAPFCETIKSRLAAVSDQLSHYTGLAGRLSRELEEIKIENRAKLEKFRDEHAARERELVGQVAALSADLQFARSAALAVEAELRSQLAASVREVVRLGQCIAERDEWGTRVQRRISELNIQVEDLHRSTSWRITGPFRRISRLARRPGTAVAQASRVLVSRTAGAARVYAPSIYHSLSTSRTVRTLFFKMAGRPSPALYSGSALVRSEAPAPALPPRTATVTSSHSAAELKTFHEIIGAMAKWSRGNRIDV